MITLQWEDDYNEQYQDVAYEEDEEEEGEDNEKTKSNDDNEGEKKSETTKEAACDDGEEKTVERSTSVSDGRWWKSVHAKLEEITPKVRL